MDYARNYELWYTGAGMHRILGDAKDSILSDSATATRAAESVLNMVGFDRYVTESVLPALGIHSNYVADRQIQHVHAKDSANIRSRWSYPLMSQEELTEALFEDELERELDKINAAVIASGGKLLP